MCCKPFFKHPMQTLYMQTTLLQIAQKKHLTELQSIEDNLSTITECFGGVDGRWRTPEQLRMLVNTYECRITILSIEQTETTFEITYIYNDARLRQLAARSKTCNRRY